MMESRVGGTAPLDWIVMYNYFRGLHMANNDEKNVIYINGKRWKIITNETHAGAFYPLHDVVACKGNKPDFVSST